MTRTIYLAGGCFWGAQQYFKQVAGVLSTEVGYANGNTPNPTYEAVCHENTGHAETVKVEYDDSVIRLPFLLDLFYAVIDPTSVNRQGGDRGVQYRTGVYFTDPAEGAVIRASIAELQKKHTAPIAIEVKPLDNYTRAEEYHQDYLDKNPGGYCHIGPAQFEQAKQAVDPGTHYAKPTTEELRQRLTDLQFAVTQQNATEPPFQNEYTAEFREGIYVDITTGEPLFISTDKFESGCGWPSFSKPIDPKLLQELTDQSHGMQRTEVRSKKGDAHLGHVFEDGPAELGGLRYCINSASLRFVPKTEMEREGYGSFLRLLP